MNLFKVDLFNWVVGAVIGLGFATWAALSGSPGGAFFFGVYALVCAAYAMRHIRRRRSGTR